MKSQNFCLTCKTTHSGDCPPHEVRTTDSDGLTESLRLACDEINNAWLIKRCIWCHDPHDIMYCKKCVDEVIEEGHKCIAERDEAREQLRIVSLVDRGWIEFEKELPEHGLSILVWMPQYMFTAHVVMGDDGQLEVMPCHGLSWPLKDYKKHHCSHWRTIMPPTKEECVR